MSNNVKNVDAEKINQQKGKRTAITVIAYLLMIVFLLIVLPVFCPWVFGYHTRMVAKDETGLVGKPYSVVYAKECAPSAIERGHIAAVYTGDSKKSVTVAYVTESGSDSLTLENGSTANADQLAGWVRAKTPYIGILTQLCFSVVGIIVTIIIFVVALALMMYVNKISKEINQIVEDQKAMQNK